jgi:aspartate carbamoyltransferase catalytic subunit
VTHDLGEVIETADVIYLLRVQRERGAEIGADYVDRYQVGPDHARKMRSGSVIMHPGPVNRGVEVTDDVIDGPRSLVREQVANGVPVRMAVLEAIAGELG